MKGQPYVGRKLEKNSDEKFVILKLNPSQELLLAPHSSTLAWKIPWTEEPGRLQSMGSLGVGHDCITFK